MTIVRHRPDRLRLRLIGISQTAGTASKTGAARSPSSSRPRRREAPLSLDGRKERGYARIPSPGSSSGSESRVSRGLAVSPFPIWSTYRAIRRGSSGLHTSSERDAFEALLNIERLDEWVRADARVPTRSPHRTRPSLARPAAPRSGPGAAGSFQSAPASLQGRADIFDATAREAGAVNDLDNRLPLFQQFDRLYHRRW